MSYLLSRRSFLSVSLTSSLWGGVRLFGQQTQTEPRHPETVTRYLQRLYDEERRTFRFRPDYPGGFQQWQLEARPELKKLIGLNKIAETNGKHQPQVTLGSKENLEKYSRQKGFIETEPEIRIPFWLLAPKGKGPFPLALLPHGHSSTGHDTHAGVFSDESQRRKALAQDRDVAVQAAERGFLAIAPATRGLAVDGVPDVFGRHDHRDCRSQLMHCLLAGRTAIGERVWDSQRIMDWALSLPEVDGRNVLMMGNSGGGMATLYTAACDERVSIAVPSCSFTTVTSDQGRIFHCDCNLVPGILEWGDLYDVAGLIAPRYLLAVNGRKDKLHTRTAIESAARRAKDIYIAAGHPDRFDHRWGSEGHRFYSDLMWPFIMSALQESF